jgi:cellobiose-specific phosphotransferase system component IIB
MYYKLKDRDNFTYNEDKITFTQGDYKAGIFFYKDDLIEEVIIKKETVFYLYYQFSTYAHGKMMFEAMLTCLKEFEKHEERRVLLCCSGGLTSAYFKEQMDHFLKLNHKHCHIEASACEDVPLLKEHYDLILVAPQMRYFVKKLRKELPDSYVEAIDPQVFATYDCARLYDRIQTFYRGEK